jgi:ketosteroid isomerase-like protein
VARNRGFMARGYPGVFSSALPPLAAQAALLCYLQGRREPGSHRSALFGLVLVASACAPAPAPPPPDTRAADEKALCEADAEWSAAAATLEGFLSYYTDETAFLPPHALIVNGKEAARQALDPLYKLPAFSVKWKAAKVEVARAGDLGYVHGAFDAFNDLRGRSRARQVCRRLEEAGRRKLEVHRQHVQLHLPMAEPPAK